MAVITDENDEKDFAKHRVNFFALIGRCVTRYQTIEDYLECIFIATMSGNSTKAKAIFQTVRGLEAKLNVISAALIDETEERRKRWSKFLPRITSASEARNQIAHGSPVQHGGMYTITVSDDPTFALPVVQISPSRMELHKPTKKGSVVWTEKMLRSEYDKMFELFGHLIAYTHELEGKEVPEHLKEVP